MVFYVTAPISEEIHRPGLTTRIGIDFCSPMATAPGAASVFLSSASISLFSFHPGNRVSEAAERCSSSALRRERHPEAIVSSGALFVSAQTCRDHDRILTIWPRTIFAAPRDDGKSAVARLRLGPSQPHLVGNRTFNASTRFQLQPDERG
jgi:hypothetical protein